MVLPEGFALPPLPYSLALALALSAIGLGLARQRVAFGGTHVLALVPWMIAGSALHVLYVLEAVPGAVAPLLGTPAVYATVAVIAGAVWLVSVIVRRSPPRALGGVGIAVALGALVFVTSAGVARGSLRVVPSLVALGVAAVLTVGVWVLLERLRPGVADVGWVGVVAVGAHTLDGVSTAVGVDWLEFGERTPLSSEIIEFGAGLPIADVLGDAWLFVLVKVALAAWIVTVFVEYVREQPRQGYALLGIIAAVGLGPAVHNVLLFAVA